MQSFGKLFRWRHVHVLTKCSLSLILFQVAREELLSIWRIGTSLLATGAVTASLELFLELLLHLFVVSRDDAVELVTVLDVPLRLIVVFVVHDAELGLLLLLRLLLALCSRLESLQVDCLETLHLHVIDLGELSHLAAATAVRLSLPIAQILSKLASFSSRPIMLSLSVASAVDPLIVGIVTSG